MSIAISTAATAIALSSQHQAREANILACNAVVQTYDSAKATISGMQQYSDCVYVLFPVGGDVPTWFVKVLIVSCFLGLFAGLWKNYQSGDGSDLFCCVCVGMLGMFSAPISIMLLSYAYFAIQYLFT